MSLINRSVVVIRARKPFLDWMNTATAQDLSLDDVNTGCPAFLIEDFEDPADAQEAIESEWDVFFETWLESWEPDQAKWPQNRSLELFSQWFEAEVHGLAFDRLDEPILHEDEFEQSRPNSDALH
jgi:hypothetical protein